MYKVNFASKYFEQVSSWLSCHHANHENESLIAVF